MEANTTLSEMIAEVIANMDARALAYREARAAGQDTVSIICSNTHSVRGKCTLELVSVERRTSSRKPHYRNMFYVSGKRVKETEFLRELSGVAA